MTATKLAMLFGSLLGGFLIFGIGYLISLRIKARRKLASMPKLPLVIAGGIGFLGAVSAFPQKAPAAEIEPKVVRQDAQGMKPGDITPEYAAAIQKFLVNGFASQKELAAIKFEGSSVSITKANTQPVAVIRIKVDGEDTMVALIGMQGSELVRITCATDHGRVDYHAPLCARAIRENLGAPLP